MFDEVGRDHDIERHVKVHRLHVHYTDVESRSSPLLDLLRNDIYSHRMTGGLRDMIVTRGRNLCGVLDLASYAAAIEDIFTPAELKDSPELAVRKLPPRYYVP